MKKAIFIAVLLVVFLLACSCGKSVASTGRDLLGGGNVREIEVSSLPEGYAYHLMEKDAVRSVIDYLSALSLTAEFPENPDEYAGMSWVIKVTDTSGRSKTLYHFGNRFLRREDGAWYRMEEEEARRFGEILEASAHGEEDAASADFEFSLTWGCYGQSSYDSATGTLIKTRNAENPKAYQTTYRLTEAERNEIFQLVKRMDPTIYPNTYDPFEDMASCPSRNIILFVRYGNVNKKITCENITLSDGHTDEMGRRFMDVHDRIREILTRSDAWLALPDYEIYFD